MSKFNTFLADHGTKIVIALLVLTYFKSCGIDSDVEKIKKDLDLLLKKDVFNNISEAIGKNNNGSYL